MKNMYMLAGRLVCNLCGFLMQDHTVGVEGHICPKEAS